MNATLFDNCARAGRAHQTTLLYHFVERLRGMFKRHPGMAAEVVRAIDLPNMRAVQLKVTDLTTDVVYSVIVERETAVLPFERRSNGERPSDTEGPAG